MHRARRDNFARAIVIASFFVTPVFTAAKEIPITKIPQRVLETARKTVPDFEILAAEREWEWGRIVYEISGISGQNGFYYEIEISRRGKILEIERSKQPEIDDEDDDEETDDDD